ncbi:MAG: histidine kinase [Ancrocorticia sp.]|jgi:signal transduction histidine kinase|nr:histidine kinase [Ancrocorticia sp.]MCI1932551.1 histidine kinase [Ancrocorticia sp.]MCI1963697.1 histidine kinase [Ancrocorticia sp.]MCI2003062.1 histidine kinase [Ancrocorticia sp.]MCI2012034.1 histidine kinase [Ancrocorticia sp.]
MADRGLWVRWREPERHLRSRDLSPEEHAIVRIIAAPVLLLILYAILIVALPVAAVLGSQYNPWFNNYAAWAIIVLWVVALFGMPGVIIRRIRYAARRVAVMRGLRDPDAVQQLTESRREIVAAFEIERRRIERDLHDGAQQYLVTASMDVGEADLMLETAAQGEGVDRQTLNQARRLLAKAQDDSEAALKALRRTVAGIHPKVLSDLGLEAAVRDVAAASPLDVVVHCPNGLPDMPEGVIAAGYFMVSEALTNAAKHAPGAHVSVLLAADAQLHISIVDDGPGGATIRADHGLAGMRERLAAFGGSLTLTSPPGGPTTVTARIPLLLRQGEFGVNHQRTQE